MPFIRIYSPALQAGKKRSIAAALTQVVMKTLHLPVTPADWCVIHFMPYAPEDLAVAGILVADSKDPDYFIEIQARDLGKEERQDLAEQITSAFADLMELSREKLSRIHIIIKDLAPGDTAIGGKFTAGIGKKKEDDE